MASGGTGSNAFGGANTILYLELLGFLIFWSLQALMAHLLPMHPVSLLLVPRFPMPFRITSLGLVLLEPVPGRPVLLLVNMAVKRYCKYRKNYYPGGNISTGGDFNTSAGNNLTFTTSAATNVTLPATGTVATLNGNEALTNKTINGLTPTSQAVCFTLAGGTSSKTLTLADNATVSGTISGTNTGDITITGQNYLSLAGQTLTANSIDLTSNVTGLLPVASGGIGVNAFGGANTILYTSAANALSSVASGINGTLITDASGVPSISFPRFPMPFRITSFGLVPLLLVPEVVEY